jgi:hypothetical protein
VGASLLRLAYESIEVVLARKTVQHPDPLREPLPWRPQTSPAGAGHDPKGKPRIASPVCETLQVGTDRTKQPTTVGSAADPKQLESLANVVRKRRQLGQPTLGRFDPVPGARHDALDHTR